MNPTIDIINAHRSIRKYSSKSIDAGLLEQILHAGCSASTSSYIQAVSIIRVIDSKKRLKIVELAGDQNYIASASEFFVFCADLNRNKNRVFKENVDGDFAWTEQFIAATVDVALFSQNVVIAAESAGLGCCYIGGIRNNPTQISELLELPNLVYPVFGLCLGYPDQQPEIKPRLPLSVTVHENNYRWNGSIESKIDSYDKQVQEYYMKRTNGKLDLSWSTQLAKQAMSQSRPFMRKFLNDKGFALK